MAASQISTSEKNWKLSSQSSDRPKPSQLRGEQLTAQGDQLQRGLPLGGQGDGQFDPPGHGLAQGRDGELAEQDQAAGNDDLRHGAGRQHAQDGAGDQHLVRDGVQDGAPAGGGVPAPGQEAVDPVGRGGDDEDPEGDAVEGELVVGAHPLISQGETAGRARQDQEHHHPGGQARAGQDVGNGVGAVGGHGRVSSKDASRGCGVSANGLATVTPR